MYKKALSLLLALMLIVTSLSVALVTVAAAGEDGNASVVKVTATSNVFPESEASFTQDQLDAQNNKVTVTYFIQSKLDMINADWKLTYDGTVLKCDEADNPNVMPRANGAFINFHPKSEEYGIKGNCTSLNAYDLEDESGDRTAFVTVTFTVIGTGDTTVNLNVSDMLVVDDAKQETQLVNDSVLNSEVTDYTAQSEVYAGPYDDDYVAPTEAPTEAPATEAPATDAPATEAPATDAPATEPATEEPVVEDTLIVAGSEAEIFGTGWDGTNEANLMTKQDDGTYTREYTVDKAYTAVQLKSVKNGAEWIGDETGNNVTFNLTGAGTFTVVYDPATNVTSVQGDIVEFITDFTYETVYAAGNGEGMWLNGAAWDPAYVANEMTEVAEGVWEIEFTNVPDGFERQIKFCIDGAWTHNFGGAFEESGVATDAVYNGDNITFDTDDTCTVKAQLDLTNFDFTTKEGAKFTITITYDEEPTEAPATEAPATEAPATEAPATEAPATEAPATDAPATDAPATDAPATDAPADKFTVKGTSNFFPESVLEFEDLSTYEDENGNVFIAVEYSLDAPGKSLINADVALTWDKNVLEYKEAYNQSNGMLNFFPFAVEQGMGAGMVNTFDDSNNGRIRANYTNISPAAKAYDDITVVKAVFKVLDRTAGETVVNCYVDTISLDDDTATQPSANYSLLNGGVVDEELAKVIGSGTAIMTEEPEVPTTDAPATDAPATDAPATDAPATDAPATDAPTTEPATEEPVVEDTLVVAGSEAEIFGTAWDGTNETNLMTKQDDGTYTREYTVDKAYTAVQLKSVKNGAEWIGDETGNNVTFNLTGPGTFTVVYDPEANITSVHGDIVEFITDFTYDTVYAAGNGEGTWLNGASWDAAYVANEMTEVADDIWEIEFTDVPDGFERQIKFFIDGAWTHNFGGAFEESGVATDAVYNGDNITFDTDDTCTVKAQLDLTNFDFTTKEGAKFTITITYDEEPTDAPATDAPATDAPTTDAPATDAPATDAPATDAPATDAPATDAPATDAPGANLTVDGTSNYSPAVAAQTVKAGDTVTVTFKAPEDADIINIQWGMNYDTDKLELTSVSSFTPDMLVNTDATSFNAMGSVSNIDTPYSVWADDDFVTFTFTAKANGETTVDFRVIDMTYREDDEDKEAFVNEVDVRGEEPVTEPATEPATDAPATEAPATDAPATEAPATEAPATEAPAGDLTVDGISNYSPNVASQTVKTGETVTVTFKAPEDANIVDVQWGAIFDTDKLELTSVSSFTEDMLVNNNPESYTVMGSVSNITTPYSVSQDDDFVTFTFTAKADGETTVDFRVIDLTYRTDNGDEIAFENEVDKRGGEEPGTEPATDAPATDAPATDAPATDAPATDAPATDAPATDAPATDAPATVPATDAPATDAPATDAPATDAPATDAPATDAPATDAPATEAPATDAPATEAPATEAPATEAPATEAPATTPEGVIGYAIVFPDGTTIDLERSDDGTFKTIIPEDRFEDGKVEFKVVQKNDDNTTTDVLDNASYDATGKGNAVATYDFVNNTITLTFTGEEPPATASPDATSATTPGGSTSDSGSTPDGGSNSGAVQTGNASMALIILLVLVSATAGIYFARKKVK